jgi:uncharacterized iron-regulated protein
MVPSRTDASASPPPSRFRHPFVSAALLIAALTALLASGPAGASGQHPPIERHEPAQPEIVEGVDYRVYDREGNPSSIQAIVGAAMGEDVLLVGEEHDDMVGHAFETRLFEAVLARIGSPGGSGRTVVLSLEMFERDVQYVLDEYLDGLISEDHFLRSVRPWDHYEARYRPLVETAREHGAPVVAANAPRRYVNRVSSEGPYALEALSEQARAYLPPLPFPGPSRVYRAQWDAFMAEAMGATDEVASEPEGDGGAEGGGADDDRADDDRADNDRVDDDGAGASLHGEAAGGDSESTGSARYAMSPNVIQAQALWDAAMGHAIAGALVRHIGGFVMHVAGSFHVERDTGIPERIADYRPGTRVVSVVMTKVDDIGAWSAEDHAPLGDFVVLTKKPVEAHEGGS